MKLISVIVPVYNVEPYIDRCIESIVNQSYTNLEIILVDDGSTDSSSTLCDKWKEKDNRILVIHKKNGGLSDARNAGLKMAKGEYIGFVDSDDWIAVDMYKKLMNSIKDTGSDIAACSVLMVYENKSPDKYLTHLENTVLNTNQAQLELLKERKLLHPVPYKLYSKKTIEGIFFEVGKQHEDVFWSYQAIGAANKVSIIDYVGYYYWQRSDSIMGRKFDSRRIDVIEAICRRQKYFEHHFPEVVREGKINILGNCIYLGQQTLKNVSDISERKSIMEYLRKTADNYHVSWKESKDQKLTHRVWYTMAGISLGLTCRLKNCLKIGI